MLVCECTPPTAERGLMAAPVAARATVGWARWVPRRRQGCRPRPVSSAPLTAPSVGVIQSLSHVRPFATPTDSSTPGFPFLHCLVRLLSVLCINTRPPEHLESGFCHSMMFEVHPFCLPSVLIAGENPTRFFIINEVDGRWLGTQWLWQSLRDHEEPEGNRECLSPERTVFFPPWTLFMCLYNQSHQPFPILYGDKFSCWF